MFKPSRWRHGVTAFTFSNFNTKYLEFHAYICFSLYFRRGLGVIKLGSPIYAIGGLDDSSCFSDVERYDPATNSWNSVKAMNSARGGVAVAVLNGLIYASEWYLFIAISISWRVRYD